MAARDSELATVSTKELSEDILLHIKLKILGA